MKITIPRGKIAKQLNYGESLREGDGPSNSGDFYASWNLDLISSGDNIRVSPRTVTHTTSDGDSLVKTPVAFVRNLAGSGSVDTYFAVCEQAIAYSPVSTFAAFVRDNIANSPTTTISKLYSDAVNFNGSLTVSTLTDLARLTSGTWQASWWQSTLSQSALTTGIPHPLFVGFTNELLIGNGNTLISITTGNVINTARITIPNEYEIMWIRGSSASYWFGARHKFGGQGKVFRWDGSALGTTGDYKIGSPITFAGVVKDDICYTVNGVGQLLYFNGGGFAELARFPIVDDKIYVLNDGVTTYPININRNGMTLIDNNIHILINASINDGTSFYTFLENMLSGIWEYTQETGLHHKYSISKGIGSDPIDYGSPRLKQAGALFELNNVYKFLAGAQLYKADGDSTTTEIGVINNISGDSKAKMGYFITPKLYGNDASEMWQKAFLTFSKILQSGEFIKLSYRLSQNLIPNFKQLNDSGSLVGTWTSATTFTTTLSYFSNVAVGDEIEVMSGEGSGLSATITAISYSNPTYTVTIDFTLTANTGTFNFRVSNWTKIDTVTDLVQTYKEFSVGMNSNWIQFKCTMYGIGSSTVENANSPEVEKLISLSVPQIKIV